MGASAIIMMIIAMVTVWGGLAGAILHLRTRPDAEGPHRHWPRRPPDRPPPPCRRSPPGRAAAPTGAARWQCSETRDHPSTEAARCSGIGPPLAFIAVRARLDRTVAETVHAA